MAKQKMLVTGASGLVGHAAVAHFTALGDWDVVGISRRVPRDLGRAALISIDLTDESACTSLFGAMSDVTHLIYAALQEQPGLVAGWVDPELIDRNARMLRNFHTRISLPSSPYRFWRKKTGPGEVSFTSTPIASIGMPTITRIDKAKIKSSTRFTMPSTP